MSRKVAAVVVVAVVGVWVAGWLVTLGLGLLGPQLAVWQGALIAGFLGVIAACEAYSKAGTS